MASNVLAGHLCTYYGETHSDTLSIFTLIFWRQPFIRNMIFKYFLSFLGCLFTFLIAFCSTKIFCFDEIQLIFFLITWYFVISKKAFPKVTKIHSHVFSCHSFSFCS